ncbi:hypothetical protein PHLGIDRAFT_407778 [Phlebiopsis gigantea 11061_1 CR5-6]|uniref:Uncharacterized protein n=1 Tax=Phlebiopsis gigantea (strain 11061_1 CR5-6) TaxID=745531 RepID=A0A0C3SB91_PHLG1|nr:hypothetical protein PHLGIDRAFT_407778 [Phlebiopsis gigantea 11061_1 CR5-6]
MSYGSPTKQEVLNVAREAISVFSSHGLSCYLVGGVACALFGNSRNPNDVDLVVLTSLYGQESLKRLLVDRPGSKFYLVPACTPGATYKVLWYRLRGSLLYSRSRALDSCKVDILIPGIMNIPSVPRDKILHIDSLPVMPIIPLILLKLQAWEDHRNSDKSYYREKQWTDVADLERMLPIAVRQGASLAKDAWLPRTFVSAAKTRVENYLMVYSGQASMWEAIGARPVAQSRRRAPTPAKARTRREARTSMDELGGIFAGSLRF